MTRSGKAVGGGPVANPRRRRHSFKVALVCMPFSSVGTPSIQVGLLTALAEKAGFAVDPYHLNLDLASSLGPDRYEGLCDHRGRMTGEWLFSAAAFGRSKKNDVRSYFRAFPEEARWASEKLELDEASVTELRHKTLPGFIDACLRAVNWGKYAVVGFTSTFQQNVASLALARRIKKRWPHVVIVFGGANMEDEMGPEYVRAFPFIDYAVVGEGDVAFPELLRSLAEGNLPTAPGLVRRTGAETVVGGQAPSIKDMDALPIPNYEEFFQRSRRVGLAPLPRLPFESSRGCWWGHKSQCTFCGLNGLGMSYRYKSAPRLFLELNELGRRHGIRIFDATDNILNPRYVSDVFEPLAESKTDFEFFYEVKANLTRADLRTMYRGGVRRIQPGIESMSTRILGLMKKGATMLDNVRLLKWALYYGIRVNWNLLWGFPGERADDYRGQLTILRQLSHLEAPSRFARIWLERFSPYFADKGSFPIREVRPEASYAFVYPSGVALEKIAYFFDYSMDETVAEGELCTSGEWVAEWQRRWSASTPTDSLTYARTPDAVTVEDRRSRERSITHTLPGPLGVAYEYCNETARSSRDVLALLSQSPGKEKLTLGGVRRALDGLCDLGLMLVENDHYLGLALPCNPNW